MLTAIKAWLRVRWGWTAAIAAGILGFIGISSVLDALRKRDRPQPPGMTEAQGEAAHAEIEAIKEAAMDDDAMHWERKREEIRAAMRGER